MKTSKLKAKLLGESDVQPPIDVSDYLSSGSTMINLACSGTPYGCLVKGRYAWFVGDSSSGKTWNIMTIFAEANINDSFKDYRFILDQADAGGAMMDRSRFFGASTAKRIIPPAVDRHGNPIFSSTVEEFQARLEENIDKGPCIYALDDLDALTTREERMRVAHRNKVILGKAKEKESGSMGMQKAKANKAGIRDCKNLLRKNGSILIIVSQTIDNVGIGAQYNPKTSSGGHALRFFADLQIWTSIKMHIRKKVAKKWREQGIVSKVQIKKNRLTGRDRTVEVPIYHSFGIDDVGSIVAYLVDEGYWHLASKEKDVASKEKETGPVFPPKGIIDADDFGVKMTYDDLVQWIEENEKDGDLRRIAADAWDNIETQCAVVRKKRYR